MSREIKFRAWDSKEKRWAAHRIMPVLKGIIERLTLKDCLPISGRLIIEQYTGLKDKNGKEIYEGDIIEVFSTDDYLARFEGVYRVYFDNMWLAYMMYKVKSHYSSVTEHFEPEMSTNIKVIGNIHENPELLGGKEC